MKKILLFVVLLVVSAASAAIVSSDQAKTVVENWLATNGASFANRGVGVTDACAERDDSGKLLWWNVLLENGGAVIVSPDTRIEPIITVIDDFNDGIPEGHPLRSLLLNDMCGRLAAVESRDVNVHTLNSMWVSSSGNDAFGMAIKKAESKWKKLGSKTPTVNGMWVASSPIYDGTPSRLIGMVDGFEKDGRYTHWNQSWLQFLDFKYNYIDGVYNMYTPKNYVTGCIATCGSALLQYFNVTQDIPSGTYECYVDGGVALDPEYPVTKIETIRQDYDWSILPKDMGGMAENPADGKLTYAQMDLLSRVPLHVGLSLNVGMQYVAPYTAFASLIYLTTSLRERYGFVDARYIREGLNGTHYDKFIYGQVRAGAPVLISLSNSHSGHQVLCVGYGEDDSDTPYVRLFMGWSGKGDAWYNLPSVVLENNILSYNTVNYVTTMISAKDSKSLALYGRVTDVNGNGVKGAVISADGISTTTGENGYWGMRVDCTTVAEGINPITCSYYGKTWTSTFTVGAEVCDKDRKLVWQMDGKTTNWYSPETQKFYDALPEAVNFVIATKSTLTIAPVKECSFDEKFVLQKSAVPLTESKQMIYEGVAYEKVGGVVRAKGIVSIKAKKSGIGYTISIKFTGCKGNAGITVKTTEIDNFFAKDRSGVTVSAKVGNEMMIGSIAGGKIGDGCSFVASRMSFADGKDAAAQAKLAQAKGLYNVCLKDSDSVVGYLGMNIGSNGKVAIKGKMIDGTKISLTGKLLDHMNANGWCAVAVYKSLYRKTGSLSGMIWINVKTGKVMIGESDGWWMNWCCSDEKGSWNKNLNIVGSKWNGVVENYEYIVNLPALEQPKNMSGVWNEDVEINAKDIKITMRTGAVKGRLKVNFEGTKKIKSFNCSVDGLLLGGGGFAFGTLKINSTKYPISVEAKKKD